VIDLPGCFERPKTIEVPTDAREYGPTAGIKPMRESVAKLYNEHHRQGKESKYSGSGITIQYRDNIDNN